MSTTKEVKKTKKNTYAPFLKLMRKKDKELKTGFVPRGLNSNSNKEQLKAFYDTIQTQFSLKDLAIQSANKAKTNQFLKQLERQRKDEIQVVKNASPIERFANIMNGMLNTSLTKKTQYYVNIVSEWRYEYKNKGTQERSGRMSYHQHQEFVVIEAVNKTHLQRIFDSEYTPENLSWDDSEFYYDCLESSYSILNTQKLIENARRQSQQLMKAGNIILTKEWLKFGKNISAKAFEDTDDTCCYHQLSHFLNNPPSNRPQQSFKYGGVKYKTDIDGLYNFFKSFADVNSITYPDFHIKSGVSCEMIIKLCEKLERSCYCYNGDDKCFDKIVIKSKHYCPIPLYKFNGHMFLIGDKECFKNIAESNKPNVKMMTSLVDVQVESNVDTELEVEYITHLDVSNAKNMESKLYIINKSRIFDEFKQYIIQYKEQPKVKTKESQVVYICFKNNKDEKVVVTCDANYGKFNCEDDMHIYNILKDECNKNNIQYTNQGFGTIVNQLMDRFNGIEKRRYLSTDEKKLIKNKTNGLCASCNMKCKKYEYDHIQSLSNGGTNDISNFQLLCVDCHLNKTTEEQQDGTQKIVSKIHSSFNNLAFQKVIDTVHFKSYQFVERVNLDDDINDNNTFKIDMKRCRKNNLYYSKYQFPVYSVMDYPNKFSGKIQCGYYFVNSQNIFPLRGNGWYCEALVDYCLQQDIIELEDIWYEFIPSNKLPSNHFRELINYLIGCFDDPSFQKTTINALIGCWGIQKKKSTFSKFSIAEDEASQWFVENSNVFIKTHDLEEINLKLYEAIYENKMEVDDNAYPLYSMILQMEALELHKIEQLVVQKGGVVLDRNTDAIRYKRNKKICIDNYFWDNDCTVPKYQDENNKPLRHESLPKFKRCCPFKQNGEFDCHWNTKEDMTAQEIFDLKKSVLINGSAGVGKTYLVNQLVELIKQSKLKYDCLAPTNKSARLINGITLDKLNFKCVFNNSKLVHWAKDLKYLIVDEISMVKEKFYRLLTNIKKINPSIIFYICGDFKQLKPVNDTWNGDYENTTALKDLCNQNRMLLTKCRRSDDEMFNYCKNAYLVDPSIFEVKIETDLNIAYTHKTRIEVNQKCMERFLNNSNSKRVFIQSDENNPKTQDIYLSKGMPIICHRTNKALEILNSDRFVITSINDKELSFTNEMRIQDGLEPITINNQDFNQYFYLAFCITSHASQGETFKEPYTIYDWYQMNTRAKYVSLSRGTKKENIQIYVDGLEKTYQEYRRSLKK